MGENKHKTLEFSFKLAGCCFYCVSAVCSRRGKDQCVCHQPHCSDLLKDHTSVFPTYAANHTCLTSMNDNFPKCNNFVCLFNQEFSPERKKKKKSQFIVTETRFSDVIHHIKSASCLLELHLEAVVLENRKHNMMVLLCRQ